MSDLDKKLDEAIAKARMVYTESMQPDIETTNRELRDAVKQVFIDAGWIPYKPFAEIPEDQRPPQPDWWSKTPTIMTGQEWYESLLLNVDQHRYHETDPEYEAQQEVLRAAKKASGLDD